MVLQAGRLLGGSTSLLAFRVPSRPSQYRHFQAWKPLPVANLRKRSDCKIRYVPTMATAKVSTETKLAVKSDALQVSQEMVDFINEAWTPFHAVDAAGRILSSAGFKKLSEVEEWDIQPGGKYFFTRNQSTLVAFAVGAKYKPGNGFHMVGAHTDSPCFKLKPISKSNKAGWQMVGVEAYGGGLWTTWFDRDLSVAGRVLVREGDAMIHKLVKITKPILRIPMLAIHLNREYSSEGFKPGKQEHCIPVLTNAVKNAIDKKMASGGAAERHQPLLLGLLAQQLGCSVEDIVDFELNLCDTQPGTIAGPQDEFVFIGRLDNLAMSFLATKALSSTCSSEGALDEEDAIRAIALFDHEEVGSDSAQGAGGPVMLNAITRVTKKLSGTAEGAVERALQNSFLVSADMAHALHPNYKAKHEPEHQPKFGGGLVLKHNVNQRYATNAVSAALFREVARRRNIPVQEFCVHSDLACGSTIGPILSSGLGLRTVDVGAPQLSMHSIREMCAVDDMGHTYDHFVAFFEEYGAVRKQVHVDDLPSPLIQGTLSDPGCNELHHSNGKRA